MVYGGVGGGHGPNGWFCCCPSTHSDEQTHFLVVLCAGVLGSRPIYHVSVFGGAAIHSLSSCLFFRSRPVSSPHLSHYFFVFLPPPPRHLSSSCFYIFDTSPSIAQSLCTPHLTKRTKRQKAVSFLDCLHTSFRYTYMNDHVKDATQKVLNGFDLEMVAQTPNILGSV